MINYPVNLSARRIAGPTLIYVDESGALIELQLTNEQVQTFVDDWNSGEDEPEPGYVPHELKPPLAA